MPSEQDLAAPPVRPGLSAGGGEALARPRIEQKNNSSTNFKSRRISQTAERLSLLFAALLVILIGILAYHSEAAFRRSSDAAEAARQVVEKTNALISSLKDAETGQRGFLLTGEDRYLEPYRRALTEIFPTLDALNSIELLRGQTEQSERLSRLQPLIKRKLDELAETIELRRLRGPAAALAVVRTNRGKALMDRIRAVCAKIQAATYDLSSEETERARISAHETEIVAILGSAAIFTLLIFAIVSIEGGTRRRQELIEALQASEEQVKRSRDWLQITLGSIGDAVISTDESGNVIFLNEVAQALIGWRIDEATGKPVDQIFIVRDADTGREIESPVTRVLRTGQVVGLGNTKLIARDGRHVPIDDNVAPIRDAAGKIAGVVLVFRDIGERKRAEKAIEQGLQDLRSANAALSRANDDLNQFAFAASHDLQEPLRMITVFSQRLLNGYRGQLEGQAAACVEFITQGTKRMRDLLDDLLAYTRVTGNGEELVEPVNLNDIFQTAVANCEADMETNASVTSDPLPFVAGYRPHFIQLFQNLISNSLKYRSERPPSVFVSAEKQNGEWRIAVRDNGIGIAPEYHKQIFGVFKRLQGQNISGTGIGLAICQRVVERYGGRIWVESEADQGATFYFTLPATASMEALRLD